MGNFNQEIQHLQSLCRITLSAQEQTKLGNQLQHIIAFLNKLQEIKIVENGGKLLKIDNSLRAIEGVHPFADTKALLRNVKHEKINNSIVIKSVLS